MHQVTSGLDASIFQEKSITLDGVLNKIASVVMFLSPHRWCGYNKTIKIVFRMCKLGGDQ